MLPQRRNLHAVGRVAKVFSTAEVVRTWTHRPSERSVPAGQTHTGILVSQTDPRLQICPRSQSSPGPKTNVIVDNAGHAFGCQRAAQENVRGRNRGISSRVLLNQNTKNRNARMFHEAMRRETRPDLLYFADKRGRNNA